MSWTGGKADDPLDSARLIAGHDALRIGSRRTPKTNCYLAGALTKLYIGPW